MSGLELEVSAPGKIILSGEHSVVYAGCPAIAASINRRTSCRLRILSSIFSGTVSIRLDSLSYSCEMSLSGDDDNISGTSDVSPAIRNALAIIKYLLLTILKSFNTQLEQGLVLTISSDLVLGAGSGSSAAFSVAVAGSVYTLVRWLSYRSRQRDVTCRLTDEAVDVSADQESWKTIANADKELINVWAYEAEKITHGTPSGLDNTICIYGGLVKLRRGAMGDNAIEKIEDMYPLEILLIDTGVPRSTADQVKKVASLKGRHEKTFSMLLTALSGVTDEFVEVLKKLRSLHQTGDEETLKEEFHKLEDLVQMNQGLLLSLGVSHSSLNRLIDICRDHGLHAKLTGAGGGGFAFAVVPPACARSTLDACSAQLEEAGLKVTRHLTLGGAGIELKVLKDS